MIKKVIFIFIPILCFGQLTNYIDNVHLHFKYGTEITEAGAGVSVWGDQSGNSYDLSQDTDGNRPDNASDLYIDFNGVNDFLERADGNELSFGDASSDDPFSIICYVYMDDVTDYAGRLVIDEDTGLVDTAHGEMPIGCYLWMNDPSSVATDLFLGL